MKSTKVLFLGFIIFIALSCDKKSEDEDPSISLSDFVGSWSATSSVYTNKANSSQVIDIIALGGELRFTLLENGGLRTWVTVGTYSDEWDSQAVVSGNTITLTPAELERGVTTFTYELEGNSLKLTNSNSSFDFTLSGADMVPATSVSTFIRS